MHDVAGQSAGDRPVEHAAADRNELRQGRNDDAGRGGAQLHPLAAELGPDRHVVDEGTAAGHAVDVARLDLEALLAVSPEASGRSG